MVLTTPRVVFCSSYDSLLREFGLPSHFTLRPFSIEMAWLASYRLFGIPQPERGTTMAFYRACNTRLIVDHWRPLLLTIPPNCTPSVLIAALESWWPDLVENEWQAHRVPWPTSVGIADRSLLCFDRPQGLICLYSPNFELALGITTSRTIKSSLYVNS